MKPIIFVRVADMKYYQGIDDIDEPKNGGSYVEENHYAHECFNFSSFEDDYRKCIGYFQTSNGDQLHIEKINGCEAMKTEEQVDNVIVVFVAKTDISSSMRVVGFYKKATVYRYLHTYIFNDGADDQCYWTEAKVEDCILIPSGKRNRAEWSVPSASAKGKLFGFGRSNVWYPCKKGCPKEEIEFVERMINQIENYNEENYTDCRGEC